MIFFSQTEQESCHFIYKEKIMFFTDQTYYLIVTWNFASYIQIQLFMMLFQFQNSLILWIMLLVHTLHSAMGVLGPKILF